MRTDERLAAGSFDYVFNRLLICGVTDWAGYMRDTVVPLLKPGGWFEMQDLDYVWFRNGEVCSGEWNWVKKVEAGARKKGLDLHCGSHAAEYMRQAGLADVSVVQYRAPFGTWAAKDRPESRLIGAHQAKELPQLYEYLVPKLVEGLGLSESEVQELVKESGGCLQAEEGKYWVMYVTVGRRPLA